jgi:pimeloyl-ACP methyl ester carboxylesterase
MALAIVLVPGLLATARPLLSTSARLDPPEITERRRRQIAFAQEGRFGDVADMQFQSLVHRSRPDLAGGIPGARLVTIAECGHLSTLERPEQVTAALGEWLQA